MVRGIVGRTAPIDATNIAGIDESSLNAWRNENGSGARRFDFFSAPLFEFGSWAPSIIGGKSLGNDRNAGWLRRPGFFAGNVGFRDRFFFDGNERSTAQTIENENAAHFRGDGDGRRVVFPSEESWLRGNVVVPNVVMNNLEAPDEFSGRCLEGDDGVGPFVVAFANAAEIVRAGAAGRNED